MSPVTPHLESIAAQELRDITVLHVEDDPVQVRLVQHFIELARGARFSLRAVRTLGQARGALSDGDIDVVLLDLGLPDSQGLDTLAAVLTECQAVPVIVLTAHADADTGVEAVKRGAQDFLFKTQLNPGLLSRSIRYAVQRHGMVVELRRFAIKLHTSHFRLQAIMEQNADGIVITNRDGIALYVNPAAEGLFARSRDEMVGMPVTQLITQHDSSEFEVQRPDGSAVRVEVRVVAMEWEGENAYLASVRDITARYQMRAVLQQAAEEWQRTFDAVEDMILVLDRNLKVLRANRAARERLGPSQVIGKLCHELVHGGDCPVDGCPTCLTLDDSEAHHLEIREPKLDDRWIHLASYPVHEKDGSVGRVVHVVRDITERKRAERIRRNLEANQIVLSELRDLAEMKSRFIEVVAHEMRTPLTVIQSGVDLLLDASMGKLNERQQNFLGIIERNIDRLTRFASDVLSLSRLDAGAYQVNPRPVGVGEALRPTLEVLRVEARDRGRTLVFPGAGEAGDGQGVAGGGTDATGEAAADLQVFADPDAMSQVVFNLVQNALMHCPEGTRVEVSWRKADSRHVHVSVADDGPGIPPDALERIFERFFQSGRKSGPGYQGTGLGLAVTRALVERQGGEIAVHSEVGAGTTFLLTLPTRPGQGELLFGRIAVWMDLITDERLREATRTQFAMDFRMSLGEILVDLEYLTPDDVQRVLAHQKRNLERPHPVLGSPVGETLFGALALRSGFVTERQLREGLNLQANQAPGPRRRRLGEVLVDRGHLTEQQVTMVLQLQQRQIAVCPTCERRYNIPISEERDPPRCPRCAVALTEAVSPPSVAVEEDLR